MHVENYAASVTALATGRAHIAWLGAVTTAQARMQMGDGLTVLGCRDIDKRFVSYFIANPSTGLGTVADLGELAKAAKGKSWTFTFGSKSSTSGHAMPRKYVIDWKSGVEGNIVSVRVKHGGGRIIKKKK